MAIVESASIRQRVSECIETLLGPSGFCASKKAVQNFGRDERPEAHGSFSVRIISTEPIEVRQTLRNGLRYLPCRTEIAVSMIAYIQPTNQVESEEQFLRMSDLITKAVMELDGDPSLSIQFVGIERDSIDEFWAISRSSFIINHTQSLTLQNTNAV